MGNGKLPSGKKTGEIINISDFEPYLKEAEQRMIEQSDFKPMLSTAKRESVMSILNSAVGDSSANNTAVNHHIERKFMSALSVSKQVSSSLPDSPTRKTYKNHASILQLEPIENMIKQQNI